MENLILPAAAPAPARPGLRFVAPLEPTLVTEPPAGPGWLHEIKHDGYRTLIVIDDGRARAFTRRGHDWSEPYAPLVEAAAELPCRSAILDGEALVQDERGLADFHALRRAIEGDGRDIVFFAFDLLHLDGRDLRRVPLADRRQMLRQVIGEADPSSCIQFSDHFEGDCAAFFAAAEAAGVEGIVSKRAGSFYRSGPSKAWLKTKCMTESEFIVVGMERNEGGPPYALLAREEEGGLAYAGSAFVILPQPARDEFWTRTERLKIPKAVVPELRKGKRKASFVRPDLRVRARHLRGGDMLRHATLTEIIK